jgi:Ca-activated chloride channel family protein
MSDNSTLQPFPARLRGLATLIAASLGCLLTFAVAVSAQQMASLRSESQPAIEESFSMRRQVAEVGVQLRVHDRDGHAVPGLHERDLILLDNGMPVENIRAFRHDDALPLQIALVIDWSDSMRDFDLQRDTALDILEGVFHPGLDRALVIGFRSRVETTQPLTGDLQQLTTAVRPTPGILLSAMYDAVVAACDQLRNQTAAYERRVIVLLSDGEDNGSAAGLNEAVRAALAANVSVYTLNPRRPQLQSLGNQVLAHLARATGGQAFFGPASAKGFAGIARDLRIGYAIYFKPSAPGGERHTLEVRTRDPDLEVRMARAYYQPAE